MKRKSLRLKGHNYSSDGYYFITICTYNRDPYFEWHPQLKCIIEQTWVSLPLRFPNIQIDEFIVMPDHFHGIVGIVGAGLAPALNNDQAAARAAPTVGQMIGTFKSLCVYQWSEFITSNGLNISCKFWQRNYYDRIIRNESELNKIRQYIQNNPVERSQKNQNRFYSE